VSITVKYCLNK